MKSKSRLYICSRNNIIFKKFSAALIWSLSDGIVDLYERISNCTTKQKNKIRQEERQDRMQAKQQELLERLRSKKNTDSQK
jgi:site-specific DNA-adenine methylase